MHIDNIKALFIAQGANDQKLKKRICQMVKALKDKGDVPYMVKDNDMAFIMKKII